MQSYPVQLLKRMLETYSPSGSEEPLAGLLHEEMKANGFTVQIDHAGNVVGELGSTGPTILLCGHMDTVPGQIPVRIERDHLYGRGAVDAKSSLAAMMIGALRAKEQSSAPLRIKLAAVVEEETSSRGIKAIIEKHHPYELAVFGEPSGSSNITIGYKGAIRVQATLITDGGHSASPWLSKNSLEEAFEFWNALSKSLVQNDASSKFSVITGCLTNVVTENAPNSIPARAEMEIDIRIPPGVRATEIVTRIQEFTNQYQAARPDTCVLLTTTDLTEGFLTDPSSLAVRAFRWAIRSTTGRQPTLVKKTGTGDINLFAENNSTPMIAYGPGDSRLDHTENEHISIGEYLTSVEVYANAILKFAELAHRSVLQAERIS